MNCSSIPDYTHTLDLVVALGGIPSAFFFLFPTDYPVNYQSAKSKVMNNKKKNEGQTDFSYYGLYLLDYLRTNKFEQADDTAFIRERADRAAETYERARLEGYPADGAQELAMDTLLRGLHYSRYAILREVVENEFADEVPEEKREAFVLKLLPLVGNVFSVYDLSDDNFALSSDYDLLYTELTLLRRIWRLTANRNCGTTSRRYGRHSSLTGKIGQRQPKSVPYFKGTAVSAV